MKPKFDQFFNDRKYGRLKFSGYDEQGSYLFNVYEKLSAARVTESKHALVLKKEVFDDRFKVGLLTYGYPPI